MDHHSGRTICYCRVHGTMSTLQNTAKPTLATLHNTPQHTLVNVQHTPQHSNPNTLNRLPQSRQPPVVPPHRSQYHNHQHQQQQQQSQQHSISQYVNCHPDMQYPAPLNNFIYSTSTIDHGAYIRQRRHRQKASPDTHLDQDNHQSQSRVSHNHNHQHSHNHLHERDSSSQRPRHRNRHTATTASTQRHRNEHKSAPSSPVSHHRSRIESTNQLLLQETVQQPSYVGRSVVVECVEAKTPVRVSSTKCRSKKKPQYLDEGDPRSPAHIPILPPPSTSTTTTTSRHVSTRHVTTGCCVAMGVNKLTRNRRPLSGSYSALDTMSNASEDPENEPRLVKHVHVTDCVKNIVSWMGKGTTAFIDSLPSLKEDHHIVMVGLDSAGKTTVLYRLKFDQYVNTVPTIGFNCERVRGFVGRSRNLTFLVWDVGGQEKIRPLWKPYTRATDAIIFVVDSCETADRMEEARLELHRIMRTSDNMGVPLLVIANKQDLPAARTTEEIEKELGLHELGPGQLWHLEPACAVTGEGLDVALESILQLIVKRKKLGKRARNKTR